MKSRIQKKGLACVMVCIMAFCLMLPAGQAKAAGTLKLNETKLTLYCGNLFYLEYTGIEDDYYWWWYDVKYTSSDTSVVVVDSYGGRVRAVGVGNAKVTAEWNGQKAVCDITVKANGCRLDKKQITMYVGQKENVCLSFEKQNKVQSYNYYVSEKDEKDYYSGGISVSCNNRGEFELEPYTAGHYYVDLAVITKSEKQYSARCEVEVLPCGPTEDEIVISNGKTKKLTVENAEILSCYTEEPYIYNEKDPSDPDWTVESSEAVLAISGNDTIRARQPGKTRLVVEYLTVYGEAKTRCIDVYVTRPQYSPFEEKLWAGRSYYPELSGIHYNSNVTMKSSSEAVLRIDTDYSGRPYLIPQKTGTAKITILADGVKFTQKVSVIAPEVPEAMLVQEGKKAKLEVRGAEGCKITYKSLDKAVAVISSSGVITAKKAGAARITVKIDDTPVYCTVSIGKGKAVTAVQKGEEVLGAAYSQEKRMQKGYYDCSSFVWRSYNEAGVKLAGVSYAPTAADLAKKLEEEGKAIAYEYVPADELRPGDIIFYGGSGNGRYKGIYHTALYYGAYFDDYWYDESYNAGIILHASSCVQQNIYDSHSTGSIVMIARPIP